MKKQIFISLLILFLSSCAVSNAIEEPIYTVKHNGNTYENVHLVNHEDGLIVFTHNMKSYYFTEDFQLVVK